MPRLLVTLFMCRYFIILRFLIFDINWDLNLERFLCCDGNHNQDGSDPGTDNKDFNSLLTTLSYQHGCKKL